MTAPVFSKFQLRRRRKSTEVETIRIRDELNVDMAPNGTIYGIELLNANEQLQHGDAGKILIINEATGEQKELPLSITEKRSHT